MNDEEKKLIPDETFEAAASLAGQAKPTYAGTFEDQLSEIYNKISNREPFQYDVNADPLYQMYKDQYIQGGKLAMKDTMGQAAALTGGYGSTYGQQVGQQAYDAYLQNLSAVIPELYGMAFGQYQEEGDNLKDLYGMAGQMRDKEYARWRDDLDDYRYDDELAYNRRMAEDETAYNRQQQAYSSLYAIIRASGYVPTDEELAASGMTREAAKALRNEYLRANGLLEVPAASSSGGGGGGGGGGRRSSETAGDNGSGAGSGNGEKLTDQEIAKMYVDYLMATSGGGGSTRRNTSVLMVK